MLSIYINIVLPRGSLYSNSGVTSTYVIVKYSTLQVEVHTVVVVYLRNILYPYYIDIHIGSTITMTISDTITILRGT